MKLLHIRHATSILNYAGIKILIDPVFADKETSPAIPMTPLRRKNPLVGLSTPLEQLLQVDLILSTHLHRDHFDEKAKELLDKQIPLICQPQDAEALTGRGFLKVTPVPDTITYQNICIRRVEALHGLCPIRKAMGAASGYILSSDHEPTIYLTGDTIFDQSIRDHIINYHPSILILNAGSPKFLYSDRIVMNIMDLEATMKINPKLCFVIVHLDTFNHCIETRDDLREYFNQSKLTELGINRLHIPEDNELLPDSLFRKN